MERIRKVFVRDLNPKERVHTVFRVTRKQKNTSRAGKSFLALTLGDKTGEVDARVFDNVDAADAAFDVDDYLLLRGHIIQFHGKPQVVIEALERLDPEPIDPKEFTVPAAPSTPAASGAAEPGRVRGDGAKVVAEIREQIERAHDPFVRQLLLAFLDDPKVAAGLPVAPAAKGVHHAYKGGLADHLLSVIKLAQRIADHYPMADRDLLLAGALLHDIGKVEELSYERGTFDYTDEGRLVGHLVMTAQKIREHASRIPGFPPALEHHITHLVLAHHGQLDYGSPKPPMTIEALLVHLIDLMDSRVSSWLELMAKDPNDRWTDVVRLYDRHLWKGPVPTSRAKSPVEPRARRARNRDEKRRGNARREETEKAKAPKEAKPSGEARASEKAPDAKPAKERDPNLPKELSFKPFSLLAPSDSSGGSSDSGSSQPQE